MMNKNNIKISIPPDFSFELILVEGGQFSMGDDNSEFNFEKPAHQVNVESFHLAQFLVTQALWKLVMEKNPSTFKSENRPVENVSWNDCQEFLKKLKEKTGKNFRLPTESEWEYAARGGKYSQGYLYAGSDKLKQVGWYNENSNGQTHEVGQLMPNELGLYDMSGNVYEWCEDDYHENYKGAPIDGTAWLDSPVRGSNRVIRGGGYFYNAVDCRSTDRNATGPGDRDARLGLRLALSLQSDG